MTGWSIKSSGGSGGGWGPYGGSDYGLTAKREGEYIDLEAGGEDDSTSYFEICATDGEGTRDHCDELSEESNQDSDSGGSESGSEWENGATGPRRPAPAAQVAGRALVDIDWPASQ